MLDNKYNYREAEIKWQKFWQDKGVYKFDKNDRTRPIYSIDTPPPTVSGNIHVGHIFSYSQAEFVARYKRMRGYNVFYPFGFDDNGLPTEVLVEKERGIRAYTMPREEFTNVCMEVVEKYVDEFKNLFIRIGNSADWDLRYHTVSPDSQKTSQLSFLDLYKKGKVYYAEAPALWCTKCRTAIAQSELETKEVETTFNHLKFYLVGRDDKYIEIATTRPELLSACVCVFVNPNDNRYADFVGKEVKVPLYDFAVPVMTDDKADMEKGTGAVMCCTFGDQTDTQWFKKYNLEYKQAIGDDGKLTDRAGKYAGLKVKDARQAIINDLQESGLLICQKPLIHQVSTHERCGTEMEINLKKQWFIKLMENKDEWRRKGDEITWYPAFMQSRYNDWVENLMMDWCISRQKYFGVPFPVWYCKDCGEIRVADESELPINPLTHSPKSACCKCGGNNFVPETDILDTWATSSVTPQINCKWGVDDETYRRLMPMSLRPNAHDIIRTWDFYTIVKSFYHSGIKPWDNIMVSGFIMAKPGEKISKSKGNAKHNPLDLIELYGADVTRYWTATGSLGRDIIFGDEEFKNGQRLLNKLYNASKFVMQFIDGYTPKKVELLPMDKWLICKFNAMLDNFVKYFDKYEVGLAMGELESFFWNFCDNYVEIVKNRLYKPEIYGQKAKESAQYVCYNALLSMLKMFAIYMPHVTEEIYQNTFKDTIGEISIHKLEIVPIDDYDDKDILPKGDEVVALVSRVRQFKSENKISLKTIIQDITVTSNEIDFIKEVEPDIKAVCSVNEIKYKQGEMAIEFGKIISD